MVVRVCEVSVMGSARVGVREPLKRICVPSMGGQNARMSKQTCVIQSV